MGRACHQRRCDSCRLKGKICFQQLITEDRSVDGTRACGGRGHDFRSHGAPGYALVSWTFRALLKVKSKSTTSTSNCWVNHLLRPRLRPSKIKALELRLRANQPINERHLRSDHDGATINEIHDLYSLVWFWDIRTSVPNAGVPARLAHPRVFPSTYRDHGWVV